jgi:sarcosine oxidase
MKTYDVAVIGLGCAGSAALNALARAGIRAIGLDRYAPPHALGSSHGETRLLRVAYAEGPFYVPLVQRAVVLWKQLERRTGKRLFERTGVVYAGPKGTTFVENTLSCAESGQVELMPAPGIERWFDVPDGWHRFREAGGGYVHPERAIAAMLAEARKHGATVWKNCEVEAIDRSGGEIVLQTARGAVRAKRIVVTTGAWIAERVPELAPVTFVERRVLHWFADPKRMHRAKDGFRPFAVGAEDDRMIYGFAANARGEVKVAEHLSVEKIAGPDALDRKVRKTDIDKVLPLVRRLLPHLGRRLRSTVCMYPMAEDERFILALHPDDPRVVIGAGLSGHGFKFAPAIGEVLANLALGRAQKVDVAAFGWPVP